MIERLLAALIRGLTLLVAGGSVESMVGEIGLAATRLPQGGLYTSC